MSRVVSPMPKPKPGDLVRCVGCARIDRHERLLALCTRCGRRVHVVHRPGRERRAFAAAMAGLFKGVRA